MSFALSLSVFHEDIIQYCPVQLRQLSHACDPITSCVGCHSITVLYCFTGSYYLMAVLFASTLARKKSRRGKRGGKLAASHKCDYDKDPIMYVLEKNCVSTALSLPSSHLFVDSYLRKLNMEFLPNVSRQDLVRMTAIVIRAYENRSGFSQH